MEHEEIRFDELRAGDVIYWYGAKVIVTEVRDAGESEYYPGERVIRFDVEPFDKKSIKMLGQFYSRGTYGGVGFRRACLFQRGLQLAQ